MPRIYFAICISCLVLHGAEKTKMIQGQRVCCILPPYILKKMVECKDKKLREIGFRTLAASSRMRGVRAFAAGTMVTDEPGGKKRSVFDAGGRQVSGGTLVRSEGGKPSDDESVNNAYESMGVTYDFFSSEFHRNSIDDRGKRLTAIIHYGNKYCDAFWNGHHMVFGDGDGEHFSSFTSSLTIVAHELAHGIIESTVGLDLYQQSGALNESLSDVFASMVKQWRAKQTVDKADWKIGEEIFTVDTSDDSLRSLKSPGEAFHHPIFGKDPQPSHFKDYQEAPDDDDNGNVHVNSGIPNHAFYLAATSIGGTAWEGAGAVWYQVLQQRRITRQSQFEDFANATIAVASEIFGTSSNETQAIRDAWHEVGVLTSSATRQPPLRSTRSFDNDGLTSLKADLKKVSELLQRVADRLS